jgi:TIR domain
VLFLSYAEEDGETAREIVQRLNDHGLEVWSWQDPRRRGRQFIQEIENAIRSAEAFLALLSPNFLSSNWCRRERDVALRREHDLQQEHPDRVFIHVLKIISTADSDTGFLGGYDWADLTNPANRDTVLLDLAHRLRPAGLTATVSARAADPGEPSPLSAGAAAAGLGGASPASTGSGAAGSGAAGSSLAERPFRNREEEVEKVLRGLGNSSGTHFWLVIAPPQLGKTWFLQRLVDDPALSGPEGWSMSRVDLDAVAPGMLRDPAALLAALFGLTSPVTTGQEALRGIARQVVRGGRPHLCLLDSAELLDSQTAAALRSCLSQIWRHVQDARRPGVRLGLVVASRRDDEWRGVTPAPRLSILPLTEFKVHTVQQALEDLAAETNARFSSAELKRYAEQVHRLTEGLPALLVECLRWIHAEEWLEMDRLETQALFEQLTEPYIRQGLLARDSLFPGGQGKAAEPLPLEHAYRLLAPYRLFTLSHLRHHLDSDPAFTTALRSQRGFMADLWKAISGTALLLRPLNEPWQAIHPTIRRLLYRHFYTSDDRRAGAHSEARKFVEVWAEQQVGKEQVIGLVECLWHEATTLSLLKPAEMERRLIDSARTLSLALESSSAYTLEELRDYAAERLRNDEELEEVVSIADGLFARLTEIIITPQ